MVLRLRESEPELLEDLLCDEALEELDLEPVKVAMWGTMLIFSNVVFFCGCPK